VKKIFIILFIFLSIVVLGEGNYVAKLIGDSEGNIIVAENIDKVHPLASVTKIMTSIVVLDEINKGNVGLYDEVTISANANKQLGSRLAMTTGQKVILLDLLKATMIHSANNAAYAMGEYVSGGDIDKFVGKMNKKAKSLGLTNTSYGTFNGLPSYMTGRPMDVSTARDMYRLGLASLNYPLLMEISGLPTTTVIDGTITIRNRNKNLDGIVDGLKTGFHNKAKYNVVITAKKNGLRVVEVLFGAPTYTDRINTIKKDMNNIFNRYENKVISKKGDELGTVRVVNGKKKI